MFSRSKKDSKRDDSPPSSRRSKDDSSSKSRRGPDSVVSSSSRKPSRYTEDDDYDRRDPPLVTSRSQRSSDDKSQRIRDDSPPRSSKTDSKPSRTRSAKDGDYETKSSSTSKSRNDQKSRTSTSDQSRSRKPESSSRLPDLDSTIPAQFPDQTPLNFAAPYLPGPSGNIGAASDYYGDQGQSVDHQPGVRLGTPIIIGAEPHLQPASAVPAPPQETGNGAAADFYAASNADSTAQSFTTANTSTSSRPPRPSSSSATIKPDRPNQSSNSNIGLYAAGAAGAAALGAAALHHNQDQSSQSTTKISSSSSSYANTNSYGAVGGSIGPPMNPSNITNSQSYARPSSQAYAHPQYPHLNPNQRQRGPVGRFVDWWNDYEDVRKMEAYTEYIGVCKYCFDHDAAPWDPPRRHRPHRKTSRESLGRSRVDKDSRYSSSNAQIKRRRSGDLSAAGLAGLGAAGAYGMLKAGETDMDKRKDFNDYSLRTGQASGSLSRRDSRRANSSPDRRDSISRGTVRRADRRESDRRESDSKRRSTDEPRRNSKSGAVTGIGAAVLGAAALDHALGSSTKSSSRRRSRAEGDEYQSLQSHQSTSKRRSTVSSDSEGNSGFFSFFSPKSSKRKARGKSNSAFTSLPSSSSSSLSDATHLAYGGSALSRKSSERQRREERRDQRIDRKGKKAILGLGAATATLAAYESRSDRHNTHQGDVFAVKEPRRQISQAMVPPKRNSSATRRNGRFEDDQWEDASDGTSASDDSIDSHLAFGGSSLGLHKQANASADSLGSASSQSSGTDKWTWRWGGSKKKSTNRKREDGRDRFAKTATAVAGVAAASAAFSRNDSGRSDGSRQSNSAEPLRYVDPVPTPGTGRTSDYGDASNYMVRTDTQGLPVQQPQPTRLRNGRVSFDETNMSSKNVLPPRLSESPTSYSKFPLNREQEPSPSSRRRADSGTTRREDPRDTYEQQYSASSQRRADSDLIRRADSKDQTSTSGRSRADSTAQRRRQSTDEIATSASSKVDPSSSHKGRNAIVAAGLAGVAASTIVAAAKSSSRSRFSRDELDDRRSSQIHSGSKTESREKPKVRSSKRRSTDDYQASDIRPVEPLQASRFDAETSSEVVQDSSNVLRHDNANRKENSRTRVISPPSESVYEVSPDKVRYSGDPIFDDEIFDPTLFKKNKGIRNDQKTSERDQATTESELYKDLESRYTEKPTSQADFFAPDELTSKSVDSPLDRRVDFDPTAVGGTSDDDSRYPHWVPKLKVIPATPPMSVSGSVRSGGRSPSPGPSPMRQSMTTDEITESPVSAEPSRNVQWGENQTREYQVETPESYREEYFASPESPKANQKASSRSQPQPQISSGTRGESAPSTKQDQSFGAANENAPARVQNVDMSTQKSPYAQPFYESVSDLGSIDTAAKPPVPLDLGFIEGVRNGSSTIVQNAARSDTTDLGNTDNNSRYKPDRGNSTSKQVASSSDQQENELQRSSSSDMTSINKSDKRNGKNSSPFSIAGLGSLADVVSAASVTRDSQSNSAKRSNSIGANAKEHTKRVESPKLSSISDVAEAASATRDNRSSASTRSSSTGADASTRNGQGEAPKLSSYGDIVAAATIAAGSAVGAKALLGKSSKVDSDRGTSKEIDSSGRERSGSRTMPGGFDWDETNEDGPPMSLPVTANSSRDLNGKSDVNINSGAKADDEDLMSKGKRNSNSETQDLQNDESTNPTLSLKRTPSTSSKKDKKSKKKRISFDPESSQPDFDNVSSRRDSVRDDENGDDNLSKRQSSKSIDDNAANDYSFYQQNQSAVGVPEKDMSKSDKKKKKSKRRSTSDFSDDDDDDAKSSTAGDSTVGRSSTTSGSRSGIDSAWKSSSSPWGSQSTGETSQFLDNKDDDRSWTQSKDSEQAFTANDFDRSISSPQSSKRTSGSEAPNTPDQALMTRQTPNSTPRQQSSTAIPLRFRRPPQSPGQSVDLQLQSPIDVASPSTQQTNSAKRMNRQGSTELKTLTEVRPLYLVERNQKPLESRPENLPSLPSSRTSSASPSVHDSEDNYESALESPNADGKRPLTIDVHEANLGEDYLNSEQTTPKAAVASPERFGYFPAEAAYQAIDSHAPARDQSQKLQSYVKDKDRSQASGAPFNVFDFQDFSTTPAEEHKFADSDVDYKSREAVSQKRLESDKETSSHRVGNLSSGDVYSESDDHKSNVNVYDYLEESEQARDQPNDKENALSASLATAGIIGAAAVTGAALKRSSSTKSKSSEKEDDFKSSSSSKSKKEKKADKKEKKSKSKRKSVSFEPDSEVTEDSRDVNRAEDGDAPSVEEASAADAYDPETHGRVVKAQAFARGFLARKSVKSDRAAAVDFQALARGYLIRRSIESLSQYDESTQSKDSKFREDGHITKRQTGTSSDTRSGDERDGDNAQSLVTKTKDKKTKSSTKDSSNVGNSSSSDNALMSLGAIAVAATAAKMYAESSNSVQGFRDEDQSRDVASAAIQEPERSDETSETSKGKAKKGKKSKRSSVAFESEPTNDQFVDPFAEDANEANPESAEASQEQESRGLNDVQIESQQPDISDSWGVPVKTKGKKSKKDKRQSIVSNPPMDTNDFVDPYAINSKDTIAGQHNDDADSEKQSEQLVKSETRSIKEPAAEEEWAVPVKTKSKKGKKDKRQSITADPPATSNDVVDTFAEEPRSEKEGEENETVGAGTTQAPSTDNEDSQKHEPDQTDEWAPSIRAKKDKKAKRQSTVATEDISPNDTSVDVAGSDANDARELVEPIIITAKEEHFTESAAVPVKGKKDKKGKRQSTTSNASPTAFAFEDPFADTVNTQESSREVVNGETLFDEPKSESEQTHSTKSKKGKKSRRQSTIPDVAVVADTFIDPFADDASKEIESRDTEPGASIQGSEAENQWAFPVTSKKGKEGRNGVSEELVQSSRSMNNAEDGSDTKIAQKELYTDKPIYNEPENHQAQSQVDELAGENGWAVPITTKKGKKKKTRNPTSEAGAITSAEDERDKFIDPFTDQENETHNDADPMPAQLQEPDVADEWAVPVKGKKGKKKGRQDSAAPTSDLASEFIDPFAEDAEIEPIQTSQRESEENRTQSSKDKKGKKKKRQSTTASASASRSKESQAIADRFVTEDDQPLTSAENSKESTEFRRGPEETIAGSAIPPLIPVSEQPSQITTDDNVEVGTEKTTRNALEPEPEDEWSVPVRTTSKKDKKKKRESTTTSEVIGDELPEEARTYDSNDKSHIGESMLAVATAVTGGALAAAALAKDSSSASARDKSEERRSESRVSDSPSVDAIERGTESRDLNGIDGMPSRGPQDGDAIDIDSPMHESKGIARSQNPSEELEGTKRSSIAEEDDPLQELHEEARQEADGPLNDDVQARPDEVTAATSDKKGKKSKRSNEVASKNTLDDSKTAKSTKGSKSTTVEATDVWSVFSLLKGKKSKKSKRSSKQESGNASDDAKDMPEASAAQAQKQTELDGTAEPSTIEDGQDDNRPLTKEESNERSAERMLAEDSLAENGAVERSPTDQETHPGAKNVEDETPMANENSAEEGGAARNLNPNSQRTEEAEEAVNLGSMTKDTRADKAEGAFHQGADNTRSMSPRFDDTTEPSMVQYVTEDDFDVGTRPFRERTEEQSAEIEEENKQPATALKIKKEKKSKRLSRQPFEDYPTMVGEEESRAVSPESQADQMLADDRVAEEGRAKPVEQYANSPAPEQEWSSSSKSKKGKKGKRDSQLEPGRETEVPADQSRQLGAEEERTTKPAEEAPQDDWATFSAPKGKKAKKGKRVSIQEPREANDDMTHALPIAAGLAGLAATATASASASQDETTPSANDRDDDYAAPRSKKGKKSKRVSIQEPEDLDQRSTQGIAETSMKNGDDDRASFTAPKSRKVKRVSIQEPNDDEFTTAKARDESESQKSENQTTDAEGERETDFGPRNEPMVEDYFTPSMPGSFGEESFDRFVPATDLRPALPVEEEERSRDFDELKSKAKKGKKAKRHSQAIVLEPETPRDQSMESEPQHDQTTGEDDHQSFVRPELDRATTYQMTENLMDAEEGHFRPDESQPENRESDRVERSDFAAHGNSEGTTGNNKAQPARQTQKGVEDYQPFTRPEINRATTFENTENLIDAEEGHFMSRKILSEDHVSDGIEAFSASKDGEGERSTSAGMDMEEPIAYGASETRISSSASKKDKKKALKARRLGLLTSNEISEHSETSSPHYSERRGSSHGASAFDTDPRAAEDDDFTNSLRSGLEQSGFDRSMADAEEQPRDTGLESENFQSLSRKASKKAKKQRKSQSFVDEPESKETVSSSKARRDADFDDVVMAGLSTAGFDAVHTVDSAKRSSQASESEKDVMDFGPASDRKPAREGGSRTTSPSQAWASSRSPPKSRSPQLEQDEISYSNNDHSRQFATDLAGTAPTAAVASLGAGEVAEEWNMPKKDKKDRKARRNSKRDSDDDHTRESSKGLVGTAVTAAATSLGAAALAEEWNMSQKNKKNRRSISEEMDSPMAHGDEHTTIKERHLDRRNEPLDPAIGEVRDSGYYDESAPNTPAIRHPTEYNDSRDVSQEHDHASGNQHSEQTEHGQDQKMDDNSPFTDPASKQRASYLFNTPPSQRDSVDSGSPATVRKSHRGAELYQPKDDSPVRDVNDRSMRDSARSNLPESSSVASRKRVSRGLGAIAESHQEHGSISTRQADLGSPQMSPTTSDLSIKRRGHGRVPSSESRTMEHMRSYSAMSNRSNTPNQRSGTPSLRRIDRSVSSDLRAASARDAGLADGTKSESSSTTRPQDYDPLRGDGKVSRREMSDGGYFQGMGDASNSPTKSPTVSRPPSMRKRQSMQIMELENKLDEVMNENRSLQGPRNQDSRGIEEPGWKSSSVRELEETVRSRDNQLREKDHEADSIRASLNMLQAEVARLSEHNSSLQAVHEETSQNPRSLEFVNLQAEHRNANQQWQQSSRELETLRQRHGQLSEGMEGVVRQEIASALEDKNAEIRGLREQLDQASQRIGSLEKQIMANGDGDFLNVRDEDYFDSACQQLCQHVQQWILRFSKFSDTRACRLSDQINDEKIETRLDNSILDGTDVDNYLSDRTKRRDVFMSVVMTMIWEYVFTRYLFGMDRDQRQKLKGLEKTLSEVGPARAVAQWRATTLTLLSRRQAFQEQREQDTQAVVQEIYSTLARLLPPPSNVQNQVQESLRKLVGLAVDLSIEMRTQRPEYIMLPPLQPEYDTNGDLMRKVPFNASLMNERSGETTSNDELEANNAIVRLVLFPVVVKKGDEQGESDEEVVVCPAQVLVATSGRDKRVQRVKSQAMSIAPGSVTSFEPSSLNIDSVA